MVANLTSPANDGIALRRCNEMGQLGGGPVVPTWQSKIQRQTDWAMIAAQDIGMDLGGDHVIQQIGRNEEIINSPADILAARATAH